MLDDAKTPNDEPVNVSDIRKRRPVQRFPEQRTGNDYDHGSVRMANNVPGIVMLACPPVTGLRFGEQFRKRPEAPPGEYQLTAIGETPLRLLHPSPGTRLKILFDELNGGGRVIRGHGFPLIAHAPSP